MSSSALPASRPYATHPDDALVQALAHGHERQAFEEIYERYWYDLYSIAYRKLQSAEQAEEVVHDVLLTLWRKRHDTPSVQQLRSYLLSAARYRIIDVIRARLVHTSYLDHQTAHAPTADHSTEDALAADDLTGALLAGLQRLPAHTQAVFRLSRFEHQTVPEIAGRLNLSPKTVEYHLTRALKALRISLRDFIVLALLWLL